MSGRSYGAPSVDGIVQYITEAPAWLCDGETIDATDTPDGDVNTENIPISGTQYPDVEGQTTLNEWGWSV